MRSYICWELRGLVGNAIEHAKHDHYRQELFKNKYCMTFSEVLYTAPAFNHISLFRMKIIVYKLSKFFKTFTKLNCAYSIGINVASITQEPGAIRNVKNYWLMGRSREVWILFRFSTLHTVRCKACSQVQRVLY